MAGKGDRRRPEDNDAVRERWPLQDPHELVRKHRAHIERRKRAAMKFDKSVETE